MTRENATDAGRQHPESWVTPEKFENDCRPVRDIQETGIDRPDWIRERIEKVETARQAKAD